MDEETLLDKLRGMIAGISFKVFLWAIRMKQEDYWHSIYRDEVRYQEYTNRESGK